MALELLLQEAQGLSEEALMEVVRFMKFIKTENNNVSSSYPLSVQPGIGKLRKAGNYRGQIWMSNDFDTPLSEFKEYMS